MMEQNKENYSSYEQLTSNDSVTQIPSLGYSEYSIDKNHINKLLIKMNESDSEFDINNLDDVVNTSNSDDSNDLIDLSDFYGTDG